MIFRRCAAILYDLLLLIALFFVLTAIAIGLNDGEAVNHPLYYLLLYVIGFFFFKWFWQHGGQTLGMQAWLIRIENEKTGPISSNQCLQRYLAGTFLFGITYAFMFVDARSRALHDRLSNTSIKNIK
ncbi:MAG: RDD family protein [Granulosicoccus sp.]